jgi:hypothetical protein
METDKALGDDPPGVCQALAIFSRGYGFKTESEFIAPIKYPTRSLVTLAV